MKLTGYTWACESLTNFEYEVHAITRKRKSILLAKIREITVSELFWAGFSYLEPLWPTLPKNLLRLRKE